jgi:hypothetical protein
LRLFAPAMREFTLSASRNFAGRIPNLGNVCSYTNSTEHLRECVSVCCSCWQRQDCVSGFGSWLVVGTWKHPRNNPPGAVLPICREGCGDWLLVLLLLQSFCLSLSKLPVVCPLGIPRSQWRRCLLPVAAETRDEAR